MACWGLCPVQVCGAVPATDPARLPACLCMQVSCLPKCKRDAHNAYLAHVRTCGRKPNSSRRKTCEESVAASMHEHLAWCHSNVLPTRCW